MLLRAAHDFHLQSRRLLVCTEATGILQHVQFLPVEDNVSQESQHAKMAKKQPPIPAELTAFLKRKETAFHCDDGDWDLKIESRDESDFKDELPPRSTVIAENGSGDCLYLKTSAAGKIDSKVF